MVNGRKVCLSAFCSFYEISEYKFNNSLRTVDEVTVRGNAANIRLNKWSSFLDSWFTDLMATFCDFMPNSNNRYLPTVFTKKSLYGMAVHQFQLTEGTTFSYPTFRKFWKNTLNR